MRMLILILESIPDTEMVAMNRDTYINADQSELKQCIKFSVMYFCEQTFLMKHTSEHTCETAINMNKILI